MNRLARAGLALGVLVTGALSAAAGSPVRAQTAGCDATAGDTSKIEGGISSPAVDYVEESKLTIAVRGQGFRYIDRPALVGGDVSDIRRIEGELVACDAQALPGDARRVQDYGGGDDSGRTFEWNTPELAWNGRYAVRLTVTAANNASRTIVQPFRMNLPASPPTGVKSVSDAAGTVTVTWNAAPATEPDTLGYIVEWTLASDDDFSDRKSAEVLPREEDAAPPTTFSHKPGPGEWRYRVVALRPGMDQQGFNPSSPSSTSTATVSAPPTTAAGGSGTGSGTGTGSTGGSTAGGSGSSATTAQGGGAARSTGTVDLTNFSRLLDQRRTATTTPRRPTEPDPGFQQTLPFRPGDEPAVVAAPAASAGQQELAQDVISDDSERRQAMTFVAASLFLAVLAYGARLVKREAERVDLEPTEPQPEAAAAAAAAPAAVTPPTAAAAQAAPAAVVATEPELPDVTSETPRPIDDSPLLRDDELAAAAVPKRMAVPRRVAATDAPHLDVQLPPRRARRPRADAVGTGNAGRAARRVSSGPRPDRGTGGEAVRPRRRGTGGSDRRTSVG